MTGVPKDKLHMNACYTFFLRLLSPQSHQGAVHGRLFGLTEIQISVL
jgi:hypothetical protein